MRRRGDDSKDALVPGPDDSLPQPRLARARPGVAEKMMGSGLGFGPAEELNPVTPYHVSNSAIE